MTINMIDGTNFLTVYDCLIRLRIAYPQDVLECMVVYNEHLVMSRNNCRVKLYMFFIHLQH